MKLPHFSTPLPAFNCIGRVSAEFVNTGKSWRAQPSPSETLRSTAPNLSPRLEPGMLSREIDSDRGFGHAVCCLLDSNPLTSFRRPGAEAWAGVSNAICSTCFPLSEKAQSL